jgi:hypothetical protein
MLAPRQISTTPHEVHLAGAVFPWENGYPVLLSVPGSDDFFLPVFPTTTKLRDLMQRASITYQSIKQIEDASVFLSSLPAYFHGQRLRLIFDPSMTSDGRVLYAEVIRHAVH